jgi:hypothetical protein
MRSFFAKRDVANACATAEEAPISNVVFIIL